MVVTCNDKFKSQELGAVPNRIMVWRFHPCERLLSIDDKLPMKASKVKWGPFDETLVSIFEEGTIWIWDSKDGAPIKTIDAHLGIITSLNFTSDRMLMITSSKDNTAKLWAMDKYELVKTYKSDRALNDAVISPLYNMEVARRPLVCRTPTSAVWENPKSLAIMLAVVRLAMVVAVSEPPSSDWFDGSRLVAGNMNWSGNSTHHPRR